MPPGRAPCVGSWRLLEVSQLGRPSPSSMAAPAPPALTTIDDRADATDILYTASTRYQGSSSLVPGPAQQTRSPLNGSTP